MATGTGVISSPAPPAPPAYALALEDKLKAYLGDAAAARVREAYWLGAEAHAGQTRKSGEPYITHPVAVAGILADLGLDAEAVIAAILHDTLEDTKLDRAEIERRFGADVAELVDGVTKLDKVQFRSRQEADAESFRKMVLAMSRDLRVILIKLADRLHNMRTLDAMAPESRRRIARETLEIYAPIAQRLGMNKIKAELQDLGFRAMHPLRHRVLTERLRAAYGTRREQMARVETAVGERLRQMGIPARLVSRVKSPYSIYTKMQSEHKTLGQVLDVYGVRVVVPDVMQCYMALGAVHSLYKPHEGRFKDFIAIPKANGYQSLHTVLFGPSGTPIEVQIRTEDMDVLAERGVAAHWSYKTAGQTANNAQARAREWLTGLVAQQDKSSNPLEFIENVKVDLFPDEVYLFTPKGAIMALPRNATALDFAYAVHTDVGNHAVAARVDRKLVPLRTRLASGQAVEIITAPSAQPSPQWLEFVVSARARTAIRHFLKRLQHEDAIELGHRMLDRALDAIDSSLDAIPAAQLDAYLAEQRLRRLEDLLADIALGNRMPQQVAEALARGQQGLGLGMRHAPRAGEKIMITGAERGVVTYGVCCNPVPGDEIMGYLSAGKGVVVHQLACPNVAEFRKYPERWVAIDWDRQVSGDFRCQLRIVVDNRPGVLATVAAAIAEERSNIENVEYQERDPSTATLLFTLEVRDRKHLADVMRRVRRSGVVHGVARAIG
jgi:guanosine-3',5'-bis(diphosphate) 3'-pyrophosphohydrolase